MKILEIKTEGFKVPDGSYAFRDGRPPRSDARPPPSGDSRPAQPADTVLVVGPPGSGKSVFLRLVAAAKEVFAPYGSPPDLRRLLRPGRTTGKLTATFALSGVDLARIEARDSEVRVVVDVEPSGSVATCDPAYRRAFAPLESDLPMTRWELFPARRSLRVDAWDLPHPPLSASIEAARRLLPDGSKYEVLRRVFYELALARTAEIARSLDARGVALSGEDEDCFTAYRAAVASMAPDLRLASVELRAGAAVPWLARRSGERLPISELTGSEEQAVLFAFASVWLRLSGAIVLVDSPEVSLSTEEQAPFVERLLAMWKGSQTFLATGSTSVASIPGATVLELGRTAGARA